MGLIRAAIDGARKTFADQWLEYYYCDTLGSNVLVQKGHKKVSTGSNRYGSENIISNGSGFAINEGQALIIVEDGKVVEYCTEPGMFTWDNSSEATCFTKDGIDLSISFETFGKRLRYGGTEAKDQRVYYINLKEIYDNKFGTATPMAYKDPTYRGIYIRYYGQYSFRIADPIVFYANVCGNVKERYTKEELMEQCHAEFITALDTTIAKCSDEGFQYNDLPKKQVEIANFMNDVLDESWRGRRGLVIESVAIEKVTPDEESRRRIEKYDDAIMMSDKKVAAGRLTSAQATAMENAASNPHGAMNGFVGMGMAAQAGANLNSMFEEEPKKVVVGDTSWTCSCGNVNTGKFCSECGKARPVTEWMCSCGTINKGKFCSECGKARPE